MSRDSDHPCFSGIRSKILWNLLLVLFETLRCAYCSFLLVNDLQGKTGVLWLILLGKFDLNARQEKWFLDLTCCKKWDIAWVQRHRAYFLNSIFADCKGLVSIHHRALGQSIGLHLWLSKAWTYICVDDLWRCRIVINLIEFSTLLWVMSAMSAFLSFCNFSTLSGWNEFIKQFGAMILVGQKLKIK